MFVVGSGGDVVRIGQTRPQHCATCGQTRPFQLMVSYRYFHLLFLFGFILEKSCVDACILCRRGQGVPFKEAINRLGRNPIPLYRRQGWLWFASPVALLVVQHLAYEAHLMGSSWLDSLDAWTRS
jgi:hypothetical protein